MVTKEHEKKLAKISEEENYKLKNRYRFNKKVMSHADPKRMPVDVQKVKDVLKSKAVAKETFQN